MATSAELYQISWVIEQLIVDPRRIVQARLQLHMGQLVKYWDWGTGKLREARIAAMKDRQVTLLDEQSKQRSACCTRPLCRSMISRQTVTLTGTCDTAEAAAGGSSKTGLPRRPARELHRPKPEVARRRNRSDQSAHSHRSLGRPCMALLLCPSHRT
ncbi:hypothetical protein [Variovorax sp. E3]|uniref:hypothetical protein n=1 Tax=Variovorax sp. E3 TaxID=1914993 RepID=UPI0022B6C387|nr:hypothetical protein [Variovorax sp. E3]